MAVDVTPPEGYDRSREANTRPPLVVKGGGVYGKRREDASRPSMGFDVACDPLDPARQVVFDVLSRMPQISQHFIAVNREGILRASKRDDARPRKRAGELAHVRRRGLGLRIHG